MYPFLWGQGSGFQGRALEDETQHDNVSEGVPVTHTPGRAQGSRIYRVWLSFRRTSSHTLGTFHGRMSPVESVAWNLNILFHMKQLPGGGALPCTSVSSARQWHTGPDSWRRGASSPTTAELASSPFLKGTVGRLSQRLSSSSLPGLKSGTYFNLLLFFFCKHRVFASFSFFKWAVPLVCGWLPPCLWGNLVGVVQSS